MSHCPSCQDCAICPGCNCGEEAELRSEQLNIVTRQCCDLIDEKRALKEQLTALPTAQGDLLRSQVIVNACRSVLAQWKLLPLVMHPSDYIDGRQDQMELCAQEIEAALSLCDGRTE